MAELTNKQFNRAFSRCEDIFRRKLSDYGASWRIMRPESITDQILIKALRIRTLETTGENHVGEGILPEFMAMVNYGIVALIQLRLGFSDNKDLSPEKAMELYSNERENALNLMIAKNHDYGEAWRMMRVSSFTDIILTKLQRIKEIEDHQGKTEVSEGVDGNYLDIINYSIFAIIKLSED